MPRRSRKAGTIVPAKWRNRFGLIPGYDIVATANAGDWFDPVAADHVVEFFETYLTHIEGKLAGKPFRLEPWQQAIVGAIFGWKRADGSRRFRESLIYVPRKNGKTPLAAGIAVYVLFCDAEQGQQNICAAAERDQAALLYRYARGMVEADEDLKANAKIFRGMGHKSILTRDETSGLKVVSSEAGTKHGGTLHLALVDELHVQKNRDLVDVIKTSMASENRREPLLLYITTADWERPGSICNEIHDYASKVRDGVLRDRAFLPVIYEATLDDDWQSPDVWARTNPNLDVSVSRDYLEREAKRALDVPGFENAYKRLHLNIRTEQDFRWISIERWDAGGEPFDPAILAGRQCVVGLDLATTIDIAAAAFVFPATRGEGDDRENVFYVLPYFWIPAETSKRRSQQERIQYDDWVARGFIEATPGDVIDYGYIRRRIVEESKRFKVAEIVADPWNASHILQELGDEDGFTVVEMRQGFSSMTAPSKLFEALVVERRLLHGGNPVLRWMASNVARDEDAAGNIKPSKSRSAEKIDGIVATINGLARAARNLKPTESIYETRGIEFV